MTHLSRRRLLHLLGAATAVGFSSTAFPQRVRSSSGKEHTTSNVPPPPGAYVLTPADEAFLDDMQRRACLYFLEQANPHNGQVLDRSRYDLGGKRDPRRMASIAATGFGLAALCIADQRGYFDRKLLTDRVRTTLRFHATKLPNQHGFFCHFNDVDTGQPWPHVEYSTIDTALLVCGVLTARAHFRDDEQIVRDASSIYERIDWPWFLTRPNLFSMGWHPASGFIDSMWNHYCEMMMLPLLAMGSPTHPVDAATWDSFTRPYISYDGLRYITGSDPLFTHQYSHAFFDFRGKHDRYTDYFQNSVTATRAHEAFCIDLGSPYSREYWGISASDSQHGYTAWGGPPKQGQLDGSVVPNAPAGSLPFLPAECLHDLRSLKDQYGDRAYGRYGFCDAFHPQADWYDPDVLGIDQGISVVMAENLRSGFVWNTFGRNPEISVAMGKAGFVPNTPAVKA